MNEWSFGKCMLVSFPIGLLMGGAFGAISAGLFDHSVNAQLEPARGLISGAGMTMAIGLGGAIAIRFNSR